MISTGSLLAFLMTHMAPVLGPYVDHHYRPVGVSADWGNITFDFKCDDVLDGHWCRLSVNAYPEQGKQCWWLRQTIVNAKFQTIHKGCTIKLKDGTTEFIEAEGNITDFDRNFMLQMKEEIDKALTDGRLVNVKE